MIRPYREEVFNSFTCWRTGQPLAVSHGEQSILATSADNYPLFEAAVKTMQPVADRYIDGAAQADDPKPLGEEFGSLTYELRGPSARYVAHFFNRDERADITKLRARNLALAALYKIPHLPRLISHSVVRNTVITTYPAGQPSFDLSAGAIDLGSYPSQFLSSMRETAQVMSVAGLVLNIDWGNSKESFGQPVAYYDHRDAGPTFLNVIARQESPPARPLIRRARHFNHCNRHFHY